MKNEVSIVIKKEYEVPEMQVVLVESQTPIMQTTGGDNPIPVEE